MEDELGRCEKCGKLVKEETLWSIDDEKGGELLICDSCVDVL